MEDLKKALKDIWNKKEALKENLLFTPEAKALQNELIESLKRNLPEDSVPALRLRKLLKENVVTTWWSDRRGYPTNPWQNIEPLLKIAEQHEAWKTVKKRLEAEDFFIESRYQTEDLHIIAGEKKGTQKSHIVIDWKNGDIRVEDDRREPTEIFEKIETILTKKDGKRILVSREAIEEL